MRENIKDFNGRVLGSIEDIGYKIIARDFYGRNLGYYDKASDTTKDFNGRVVARGNAVTGLVYRNSN